MKVTHLKVAAEAEQCLVGGRQRYNDVIDTIHRSVGATLTAIDVTHGETLIIIFQITAGYLFTIVVDVNRNEREAIQGGRNQRYTLTVTVSPSWGMKLELQCSLPAMFQKIAASKWFLN